VLQKPVNKTAFWYHEYGDFQWQESISFTSSTGRWMEKYASSHG